MVQDHVGQELYTHIYEDGEPLQFHSYNDALNGLVDYQRMDYICTFFLSADRKHHNVLDMRKNLDDYAKELKSEEAHNKALHSDLNFNY